MRTRKVAAAMILAGRLLISGDAVAEVTRFDILTREPFAGGASFGEAGTYDRIVGRVHQELDPELPPNVRVYCFGGTQHGPSGFPPNAGDSQTLANPADYKPFLRALVLALDRWSRDDLPPPPSVYPTIGAGDLVGWRQESTGFPSIPGVLYPSVIQQPAWLDFGPRWERERIVDHQPPVPRDDYRVLVPRTDADGNDRGCLLPPEVAVPVATYTGWSLRSRAAGAENELVSLQGSYLPFPVLEAEREKSGDPRRSLEERYGGLDDYLDRLRAECVRLHEAGYLLQEDVKRIPEVQRHRVAPLFEKLR